jgi:uncharacterized protein/tRNA (cytidine56-2'-O)-methyltransferase
LSIYPSDLECIRILRDAGCSRRVILHCCTVRTVAEEMARGTGADMDLVIAGAMLHDIGRSRDHSIFHAVVGAEMGERLGLPKELTEIIRKHTGAGLDRTDAEEFGLPPGDYIPCTIEEKMVAHADNLVSDDRLVAHTFSSERLRRKGGVRGAERMERLHQELSAVIGRDPDTLADELGEYPKLKGPCSKV